MQLRLALDILLHYFLISASFFGLFLLPILTFSSTHASTTMIDPLQKKLIGSIFGGICLLGIVAAVFPSRCSQMLCFRGSKNNWHHKSKNNTADKRMKIRGHHPTCNKFSNHIIQFGDKIYCSGCLGMIIGAMIVLPGSIFYFFTGYYPIDGAIVFFWLGFFLVAGGILHYTLLNLNGIIRLIFNVLFVLGTFFLFIGIEMIANNLVLELYFITLIIYWIIIRIIVSKRRHQKICMICNLKSCICYE